MEYRINHDELMHYGILGMKWGVRNAETRRKYASAGKPPKEHKYYTIDKNSGFMSLNRKGRRYNERASSRFNSYKSATLANATSVHPKFKSLVDEYTKLEGANKKKYAEEWNNPDNFGLTKEEFKDKAYSRWMSTKEGRRQAKVESEIRNIITATAKEHPLYDKKFKRLKSVGNAMYGSQEMFETVDYGKEIVNQLMMQIRLDAYKNSPDYF